MIASPFPFARRKDFSALRKQHMNQHCESVLARATQAQAGTCRRFFDGLSVGRHQPVEEVNSFECSLDGPDLLAHRTFRFQDTGRPAFDFRTQLVRISPDGSATIV